MPTEKNGDGSLAWLRDRNRRRVMEVLRMQGRVSQADISRVTGLSRTTISTMIAELRKAGLVLDIDTRRMHPRGGRPGVELVLRDPAQVVVGIDFGHSHIGVAVADLGHNVLVERREELDVNREAVPALDSAARMFADVLARAGLDRGSVLGAGIGIPGPVDLAHGTAGSATILPGWVGLRIASEMEQRLGVPVEIENDANLGALAELTWGAGLLELRLHQSRDWNRRGHRRRRAPAPRRDGNCRGDRAHDPRRGGAAVLLRQPRVPGDRGLGSGDRRPRRPGRR